MHLRKKLLLIIFMLLSVLARGQQKRQITKEDERKINRAVKNIILGLSGEYNFFLTEASLERKERLNKLVVPGVERIFLNDQVICENDFADREINDLPKKEQDKTIENYFSDLASKFGINDNGEGQNQGKYVNILINKYTKPQAVSAHDSIFVKVFFTISYEGEAHNGFKFKEALRVAEMQLEKNKKEWRAYISLIKFNTLTLDSDYSGNVVIVDENSKNATKYEEAINAETKTVSRNPLLKAFKINEMWGLLNDEDNEKRILIEPQWCDIDEFTDDGLASVCYEGSWGYINRTGEIVIPCQYESVEPFKKGKALVQVLGGTKPFSIDVNGKRVK